MLRTKDGSGRLGRPQIIQGGMGVGVSGWQLAQAVARCGAMGVVSGTALDTVLIRRLQEGDPTGTIRRALEAFPLPAIANRVLEKWFVPGGKAPDKPYRTKPLPTIRMSEEQVDLLVVANFAEVFLAKADHDGPIGINYLEKIQLPTLPSLYGAMLAQVDAVIMGGGIPLAIPGALDALAKGEPTTLRIKVAGAERDTVFEMCFDPTRYAPAAAAGPLNRPEFIAIVSSDTLAKTLVKRATGTVNGFIVEQPCAGGHNAPPRRGQEYGPRDQCDLSKIRGLGLPFWLAGGCATRGSLEKAKAQGAEGIQAGSIFACANESGILPSLKAEVVRRFHAGTLNVLTDFEASPTGYPFKRVELDAEAGDQRAPACDLGYLRQAYQRADGSVGYRCAAAPRERFIASGGSAADTLGKRCLCNGLMATIGLGQRHQDQPFPPLVTLGEDLEFLATLTCPTHPAYSAADAIAFLEGRA